MLELFYFSFKSGRLVLDSYPCNWNYLTHNRDYDIVIPRFLLLIRYMVLLPTHFRQSSSCAHPTFINRTAIILEECLKPVCFDTPNFSCNISMCCFHKIFKLLPVYESFVFICPTSMYILYLWYLKKYIVEKTTYCIEHLPVIQTAKYKINKSSINILYSSYLCVGPSCQMVIMTMMPLHWFIHVIVNMSVDQAP